MASEVHVPGLGSVEKKYVIGGVLVGGGVALIFYVRHKKSAAAADTTTAMVTDPAGNQCTALSPTSGYCPGTPEDMAYSSSSLSGGYDGNFGYPASGIGGGGSPGGSSSSVTDPAGNVCSAVNPATGYCPGSSQDLAAQGGSGSTTNTEHNSDWVNEALGVLPGDFNSNQTALSAVLAGLVVSTAQKNVFLEAVALVGQPPQGYPTPIKTSDTSAHPGTNPGSTMAGPISNLQPSQITTTSVTMHWNPAPNAKQGYHWHLVQLNGGGIKDGNTNGTSVTITGLHPGWHYNFSVQGLPGGPGNNYLVMIPSK